MFGDAEGTDSGAAYVFGRDTGGVSNWGQIKKFTSTSTVAGDKFGASVTIYQSYYLVIGAPGASAACLSHQLLIRITVLTLLLLVLIGKSSNSGGAYVYFKNQGGTETFGETAALGSSGTAAGDYYGQTVSISSSWVVIGAYKRSAGQAYVYEGLLVTRAAI